MAKQTQLSRTPIREALVDIRVAPDIPVTAERLAPLRERIPEGYAKADERRRVHAQFRIEKGKIVPPLHETAFGGLWLKTEQEDRIAQFRPDGFTLNHVGTYSGGDAIIDEALRLWAVYRELIGSLVVTRVAMRYINDLKLPIRPTDDFERFLTEPARLPTDGSPQLFSSFLTRVVAHEDPDVVIVTQQMEVTEAGVPPSITIDIDAGCQQNLSAEVEAIRRHLERLRALKNRVFFSLLTEEAVSLYL